MSRPYMVTYLLRRSCGKGEPCARPGPPVPYVPTFSPISSPKEALSVARGRSGVTRRDCRRLPADPTRHGAGDGAGHNRLCPYVGIDLLR